ncbi:hypothetical protein HDU92_002031 [Lobulomyces angularis]|nr:hypothetical protein HDU92_002031 [Lobulomyces angularis]
MYLSEIPNYIKFTDSQSLQVFFYALIYVPAVLGNSLVFFPNIIQFRSLTASNIILMSLILSDILFGLTALSLNFFNFNKGGFSLGYDGCSFLAFMTVFTCGISLMSCLGLTYDRYSVIVRGNIISRSFVSKYVVGSWIICTLLASLPYMAKAQGKTFALEPSLTLCIVAWEIMITPVFFIAYAYTMIYLKVRQNSKSLSKASDDNKNLSIPQIKVHNTSGKSINHSSLSINKSQCALNKQVAQTKKLENRVLMQSIAIVTSFLGAWTPYLIRILYEVISGVREFDSNNSYVGYDVNNSFVENDTNYAYFEYDNYAENCVSGRNESILNGTLIFCYSDYIKTFTSVAGFNLAIAIALMVYGWKKVKRKVGGHISKLDSILLIFLTANATKPMFTLLYSILQFFPDSETNYILIQFSAFALTFSDVIISSIFEALILNRFILVYDECFLRGKEQKVYLLAIYINISGYKFGLLVDYDESQLIYLPTVCEFNTVAMEFYIWERHLNFASSLKTWYQSGLDTFLGLWTIFLLLRFSSTKFLNKNAKYKNKMFAKNLDAFRRNLLKFLILWVLVNWATIIMMTYFNYSTTYFPFSEDANSNLNIWNVLNEVTNVALYLQVLLYFQFVYHLRRLVLLSKGEEPNSAGLIITKKQVTELSSVEENSRDTQESMYN